MFFSGNHQLVYQGKDSLKGHLILDALEKEKEEGSDTGGLMMCMRCLERAGGIKSRI